MINKIFIVLNITWNVIHVDFNIWKFLWPKLGLILSDAILERVFIFSLPFVFVFYFLPLSFSDLFLGCHLCDPTGYLWKLISPFFFSLGPCDITSSTSWTENVPILSEDILLSSPQLHNHIYFTNTESLDLSSSLSRWDPYTPSCNKPLQFYLFPLYSSGIFLNS